MTITAPTAAGPPTAPTAVSRLDRVELFAALARAPIGDHGMLEAAIAWQILRPAERWNAAQGWHAAATPRLTVVETRGEPVAARVARLLFGVAWATVAEDAGPGPGGRPVFRVEVPKAQYPRVLRVLNNAWRGARRAFDPRGPVPDPRAAVELWRMGILAGGRVGGGPSAIHLRAGTVGAARTLAAAAGRLGLTPIVDAVRADPAVSLSHPGEVHWLLAQATAEGPAAPRPGTPPRRL
ncbi:hypothetical protein Sru01_31030 [Sphaerisporangium rufum]|uniref:Uncharacterized protein n=1 Tax=Sphaerisporangium rufum TaxID=1381558 RepID=A0A919R493_9ACTN|nr:hypothetical protein [Sphaerisporangium rufum]GII78121.1 hypothetical protein Sru01_31030 [Sphaerisporangium rufum]